MKLSAIKHHCILNCEHLNGSTQKKIITIQIGYFGRTSFMQNHSLKNVLYVYIKSGIHFQHELRSKKKKKKSEQQRNKSGLIGASKRLLVYKLIIYKHFTTFIHRKLKKNLWCVRLNEYQYPQYRYVKSSLLLFCTVHTHTPRLNGVHNEQKNMRPRYLLWFPHLNASPSFIFIVFIAI